MTAIVASIPSPSSGALNIGPLSIHAYGLMIALGVIAAVWLLGRRLESSGEGTREDASAIAVWAVAAGVIGARLYHVATDWSTFEHDLGRIPQIWRGGLGIPGGILGGTLAAAWAFRRRGIPAAVGLSAAAPTLPLAQAIGRWGNWWNQELFGKPTTLPWALKISADKVPVPYPPGTTFHPTFLYESLWNLALCVALLRIDRKFTLRPGRLFAVYVVGYAIGRFWIEGLRIDPAHTTGGLRLNQWVALVVGLLAAVYLAVDWRQHHLQLAEGEYDDDEWDDDESIDDSLDDEDESDVDVDDGDAESNDEDVDEDSDGDGHDVDAESDDELGGPNLKSGL